MMHEVIIQKGQHRPDLVTIRPQIGRRVLSYYVEFTESCIYYLPPEDEGDLNKLPGIAQGYHRWNSIRPGWRWNRNLQAIELFAYAYRGGENLYTESLIQNDNNRYKIGNIGIGQKERIDVFVKDGHYLVAALGNEVSADRNNWPNVGYITGHYFGGDNPAQHDTIIKYLEL